MSAKLTTAVVGATGYSGLELARILSRHPCVEAPLLLRGKSNAQRPTNHVESIHAVNQSGPCSTESFSWGRLEQHDVQLLFLATPHEASRELLPEAVSRGYRVIDLSGAWRLKQAKHRALYGFEDANAELAEDLTLKAIYGLPELHATAIAAAQIVANPGCYATSVILALAPLLRAGVVELDRGIISDSKSGVSGAGKEPTAKTHFVAVADNLSAYSIFYHRHVGEIAEQLGLETSQITFTPHLLPIPRGILSTVYVYLRQATSAAQVEATFKDFYESKPWVRIFATPSLPQIQFSLNTNFCDIGFCLHEDGRRLVLVSCLDNLLKGAAGQAVQNMNLMQGWGEKVGLQ